ncbi:hypothetical protein D8674_014229 [Pyrus ussuriensis x Pyrus communis]|uniref:Uncharacterized protein n=1 Tax=Pyrus ussuriensis x Pyrus communis TaxID=2448454 RepID=A0A5N5GZ45_9ROSA|nr:hypothetical protein D8674_014229 [Pyrus ussuriensis x Pyrus communis]
MVAKAQPSWWSPAVVTVEEKEGRAENEVMANSPCTRRRRLAGWVGGTLKNQLNGWRGWGTKHCWAWASLDIGVV